MDALSQGGLNSTCVQGKRVSQSAGTNNNSAAVTCINAYQDCDSACRASGDTSRASACLRFSSLASQLSDQAKQNYNVASNATECDSDTSAAGGGGSGTNGSSGSKMADASTTSSEACAQNPSLAGCASAASATQNSATDTPSATLSTATTKTDPNAYNTGDTSQVASGTDLGGGGSSGQNAPTVKPIANNSGGGFGAGGGGANSNGIMGNNTGGGLFGASSSVADIDRGLRAGGGYSQPGGPGETEDPDAPGAGLDPQGRSLASTGGVDLKTYMPGMLNGSPAQRALDLQRLGLGILPPHISLWSRISEKMVAMCTEGRLLDCK